MLSYLYVAVGSAIGGVARWAVGGWMQRTLGGVPPTVFPVGTLFVNATGSFVLGALAVLMARQSGVASQDSVVRLMLAVGFCGGYTTFSTFSLDTVALLESRGWAAAVTNVAGNLGLGIGGLLLGMVAGRAAWGKM
jgi:CrcB protein